MSSNKTLETGAEPKMWGSSLVGFGQYHYTYESGREGDFILTGFSPRKAALTVYTMPLPEEPGRGGPGGVGGNNRRSHESDARTLRDKAGMCGVPVCGTFGCREQPKSAHGRLERVLQTGTPYLPAAGTLVSDGQCN